MKRLLFAIPVFLFISFSMCADASARVPTFTSLAEMNAQIRQNEHDSAFVYQVIMRATDLNLLRDATKTYAHLSNEQPKNWLMEAGKGFAEFLEVGYMSKWMGVSRDKWPHSVSALYERGFYARRLPFQTAGFSYSGAHSIREAAMHLPKDPYVMIMDCFANFYGVCTYEGYTGKDLQQFRDLAARYIAKMKYVTMKYPQIGDAWGLYAEAYSTLADSFFFKQNHEYLRYTQMANHCFQKMNHPSPYWYDNMFSMDCGFTWDILGHPRKALQYYNFYYSHCDVPTDKRELYTFNEIKDQTYKLVHKEIATHKNLCLG